MEEAVLVKDVVHYAGKHLLLPLRPLLAVLQPLEQLLDCLCAIEDLQAKTAPSE